MIFLYTILIMLAAHYVADFAMQNDYVAQAKAKVWTAPDGIHALVAHSMHHGVAVALGLLILGVDPIWIVWAAVITAVSHGIIDYGKAVEHWFGYHADQIMHLTMAVMIGTAIGTLYV